MRTVRARIEWAGTSVGSLELEIEERGQPPRFLAALVVDAPPGWGDGGWTFLGFLVQGSEPHATIDLSKPILARAPAGYWEDQIQGLRADFEEPWWGHVRFQDGRGEARIRFDRLASHGRIDLFGSWPQGSFRVFGSSGDGYVEFEEPRGYGRIRLWGSRGDGWIDFEQSQERYGRIQFFWRPRGDGWIEFFEDGGRLRFRWLEGQGETSGEESWWSDALLALLQLSAKAEGRTFRFRIGPLLVPLERLEALGLDAPVSDTLGPELSILALQRLNRRKAQWAASLAPDRRTVVRVDSADVPLPVESRDSDEFPASAAPFDSGEFPLSAGPRDSDEFPASAAPFDSGEFPLSAGPRDSDEFPASAAPFDSGEFPASAEPRDSGEFPLSAEPRDSGEFPLLVPAPAAARAAPRPAEDLTVLRYPSVNVDGEVLRRARVILEIDLLLQPDRDTQSKGVRVVGVPDDWNEIDVTVQVSCPHLIFEQSRSEGVIVIHRSGPSVPCRLPCTVSGDAPAGGNIHVIATFYYKGRYSGAASRMVPVARTGWWMRFNGLFKGVFKRRRAADGVSVSVSAAPALAPRPSHGLAFVLNAPPPALTVQILASKRRLRWVLVPRPDLRVHCGRLEGEIKIPRPDRFVRDVFKDCASRAPGDHVDLLNGIGELLFKRAPPCFGETYWRLREVLNDDSFAIQFVTDDPYIPWEFMRPLRSGAPPGTLLATSHSVGRWFVACEHPAPSSFPLGHIATIAPDYSRSKKARALPRAIAEAESLYRTFGAIVIGGKKDEIMRLLKGEKREGDRCEPIRIMHFAGHGSFKTNNAALSQLLLDDDLTLVPLEVDQEHTRLGHLYRPLVILNACEAGETSAVLGQIGGWAECFASRKFGGVVAPLWSIDDHDAGRVMTEFVKAISNHEPVPVGTALQQIRARHGTESATYMSYVYFGDPLARFE